MATWGTREEREDERREKERTDRRKVMKGGEFEKCEKQSGVEMGGEGGKRGGEDMMEESRKRKMK